MSRGRDLIGILARDRERLGLGLGFEEWRREKRGNWYFEEEEEKKSCILFADRPPDNSVAGGFGEGNCQFENVLFTLSPQKKWTKLGVI